MALIKQQLDLLDRLNNEMETGKIPSQAGLLTVDGVVISHYTDRNSNDTITIPKDSFLRRVDKRHNEVPRMHTSLSIAESSMRTIGIDSIIQQLGLGEDTIKGVLQFDIQTSYTQKDAAVVRGIMINPLESVDSRKVRNINESDPETLNLMVERYQAEFALYESLILSGRDEIMAGFLANPGGLRDMPAPEGYTAASFLEQLDLLGGDIVVASKDPKNGTVAYGVGDITGHGVKVAGLNKELRSSFITMNRLQLSLDTIVNGLNLTAMDSNISSNLTPFFTWRLHPSGNMEYCPSGTYGFIVRSNGRVEELEANLLLGAGELVEYSQINKRLKPGDLVLSLTDGHYESSDSNGRLFGKKRVIDLVTENRDKNPKEIIGYVEDEVRDHVSAGKNNLVYNDDRSIVIVKRDYK